MLTFKRTDRDTTAILRRGQVVGRLWWGPVPVDVSLTVKPPTLSQAAIIAFLGLRDGRYSPAGWLVELDGQTRAFSHKTLARAWAVRADEERRSA